jgi:hypothetical protein
MSVLFVTLALLLAPLRAESARTLGSSESSEQHSSASSASAAQSQDPVAHLRAWMKLAREGRVTIDKRSIEDLKNTVGDLRTLWALNPPRGEEIELALLDLVGYALSGYDPTSEEPDALNLEIEKEVSDAFKDHMDPDLRVYLAHKVLALSRSQPLERRIAAAWLSIGMQSPDMKLALFGCARDPDPRLRSVALEALKGWEDEGIHALFLNELVQALAGKPSAQARRAEEHFKAVHIAAGSRVLDELAPIVKTRLASSDWRVVSQAVTLSRPLPHAAIVPFLIEALAEWKKRADAGAQGVRVEFEILHALELRSGRKLGPNPESWRDWWAAVQKGEVKGQTPMTTGGEAEPTRPSFFGLKPVTDRVTFVLDRSGSMDTPFGKQPPGTHPKKHTRWDEAVSQLASFVEAIGEKARFNVVIFHDYAEMWKPVMADANKENRKAAREWLAMCHPGGGTELRSGINRAMMIDSSGMPDLALLEADTVIVLCDGATDEGPQWVAHFMNTANAAARVVFDCVEIGNEGDGTLPRLARESGGEYLRIDG